MFLSVNCLFSSYLCVSYSTLQREFAVPKPRVGIVTHEIYQKVFTSIRRADYLIIWFNFIYM